MKPTPSNPPPKIPDYDLLRQIGRGSYGDVWLARSITGHYRAVKIVWRDRFNELPPFEREFKGLREFATVSLTEPYQLALLHVGRNHGEGYFYYVMELADDVVTGREVDPANYTPHTLKETRERQGRLPAGQVIAIGYGLARALSGLHARGLVHRDVKPSNVIFVGGTPKLADIGLVSVAASAATFVGTEGFVPPEGPGSPGADVFGLGKLLYEMATGLDRHDYPRLPPELGSMPDHRELLELNEILIQACCANPADRYPDASAMLDDLKLLKEGRSMRRLHATERRLSRTLRAGAALALVAVVVGSGAFLERQRAVHETALRRVVEAERDELARQSHYLSRMAAAQTALGRKDHAAARAELSQFIPTTGSPDRRDERWHELWRQTETLAAK